VTSLLGDHFGSHFAIRKREAMFDARFVGEDVSELVGAVVVGVPDEVKY
jgi:hypothetical protein